MARFAVRPLAGYDVQYAVCGVRRYSTEVDQAKQVFTELQTRWEANAFCTHSYSPVHMLSSPLRRCIVTQAVMPKGRMMC